MQSIIKQPLYLDDYHIDLISLFDGSKSGHLGKWHYDRTGTALWEKTCREAISYKVCEDEIALINTFKHEVMNEIKDSKALIDIGAGHTDAIINKTGQFKEMLNIPYFAVDHIFVSNLPFNGEKIYADFMSEKLLPTPERSTLVLWGLTAGNLPNGLKDLPHFIRKLYKHSKGGKLIITIDTERDVDKVSRMYNDLNHVMFSEYFIQSIGQSDDVSGFNHNNWKYELNYNDSTGQAAHCMSAKADNSFIIGDDVYHMNKGNSFIVDNSWKFKDSDIKSSAIPIPMKQFQFNKIIAYVIG